MGEISLCILFLLVPMGGAFEGTEGVMSGAQTPCPDPAGAPGHPLMVTPLHWTSPLDKSATEPTHGGTTMPAVTTAAASNPTGSVLIVYVAVIVTFWFIAGLWYCYNWILPLGRSSPGKLRLVNMAAESSSMSSDNMDGDGFLGRDQAEGPDDVLPTCSYQAEVLEDVLPTCSYRAELLDDFLVVYGDQSESSEGSLSSWSQAETVVMVHHARSDSPDYPVVSTPPDDVLA